MIFYGIVFVVYAVSSIVISVLNISNFIIILSFYIPLYVPHVFVFETLFVNLGLSGILLHVMLGVVVGLFGAISLVSAFTILRDRQFGIPSIITLMVVSIIFSIFSVILTDFEHPGYQVLSIFPLIVSSLVLYYVQIKYDLRKYFMRTGT